jgi:hypothetical protein
VIAPTVQSRLRSERPGFNYRQGAMMGFFLFATASRPRGRRDSSAVQRWAVGWMIGGLSPVGAGNCSHHRVQTGSGTDSAS